MKTENKKHIIQLGDVIEFKYRLKPIMNNNDDKVFKIDEVQRITIGKDELFNGLDQFIIGMDSSNKHIEINDFLMPDDHLMFPNERVHVGIKLLKHEKQETNEVIEPSSSTKNDDDNDLEIKLKELESEKKSLLEKISKLEIEQHALFH